MRKDPKEYQLPPKEYIKVMHILPEKPLLRKCDPAAYFVLGLGRNSNEKGACDEWQQRNLPRSTMSQRIICFR